MPAATTEGFPVVNKREVPEAYDVHKMVEVEPMKPNENAADKIIERRVSKGLNKIQVTKVLQSKVKR